MSRFSLNHLNQLLHRPARDHLETLSWYLHQVEYQFFVRRYSLNFDGFIPREKLVASSQHSLANSNNYRPYSNFHLKHLLLEALSTGITFDNFVDVGCGKGQQCMFAKKYFNFTKVIGIDFCEPLIDIANRNLANTRYKNVTFLVADATTWRLPAGNNLVFLFNPFNEIILERFIQSNLEHFATYKSMIAYGNDCHRSTLCRLGFEVIYRSDRHRQSLLSYSGQMHRAA